MSVTWSDTEKGYFLNGTAKRNLYLYFSTGVVPFAIDNSQIVAESMQISESICDDRQLDFGLCTAREFKVRVTNTVTGITSGIGLYPSIQLIDPDDSTNILASKRIGTYTVKSAVLTDDRAFIDITAYDALSVILITNYADWHNGLTFPMTLQAYFEAFLSEAGLTLSDATDTLPCASATVTQSFTAENYTGYDILYAILRPNGAFGYIDDDGTFRVKVLAASDISSPAYTLDESDYKMGSFVYSDYNTVAISGIQAKETETDIGVTVGDTDGSVIVIEDDPLLYGKTQDELTTILTSTLNSVDGYIYTPASVTTPWMPWIKLGEAVQVSYGDTDVVFPMLYRNISGIVSTMQTFGANGTNEPLVDDLNTASREIRQLQSRQHKFVNDLDTMYSEITQTITETQETLTSLISQTAGEIELKVENIQFGAENLAWQPIIYDTNDAYIANEFDLATDGSFSHIRDNDVGTVNGNWGVSVTAYSESKTNTSYIVRFLAKLSDGGPISNVRFLCDYLSDDDTYVYMDGTLIGAVNETIAITMSDSTQHEFVVRFTMGDSIDWVYGDLPTGLTVAFNYGVSAGFAVDFQYLKWERGNTNPTDWSPSPKDLELVNDANESAIGQRISAKADITMVEDSISSSVSEIKTTTLAGYITKETLKTSLEETAKGFEATFSSINETISENQTETGSKFTEISQYIRFEEGNIILGENGNELLLKIENDIIGFYNGNTRIAYFSNNKLYVTDGEFTNSLRVGYLEMNPRSDKSLDITYNVDD